MVDNDQFIGYVGIPDIHDATVIAVHQTEDKLSVSLQSYEQRFFRIEFYGVESVTLCRPEGIVLFALSEMRAPVPIRHFVFANWDEKDDALLEVRARGFTVVDKT